MGICALFLYVEDVHIQYILLWAVADSAISLLIEPESFTNKCSATYMIRRSFLELNCSKSGLCPVSSFLSYGFGIVTLIIPKW